MIDHIRKFTSALTRERSPSPEIISYQTIRKAIGWLGILLPFILIFGAYLFANAQRLQPSISHYYYTNMREVFVGILCAVSLFLFTYKGHSKMDSWAANSAGFMALGIALFPTNFMDNFPGQHALISLVPINWHDTVHEICAGLFFIILAFMSLFLFTKSNIPSHQFGFHKRARNIVYKVCGYIMLLSVGVIAISKPVLKVSDESTTTFWMEVILLVAFGTSWLVKGEALLGDPDLTEGNYQ